MKDKNIPQTLCEFFSFSPNTGERKPKCSAEHLISRLNCFSMHLHKGLPILVPLEEISVCLQVMKLSRKEAFKWVTCLWHEATKFRVWWALKHWSEGWDLMCPNGSVTTTSWNYFDLLLFLVLGSLTLFFLLHLHCTNTMWKFRMLESLLQQMIIFLLLVRFTWTGYL